MNPAAPKKEHVKKLGWTFGLGKEKELFLENVSMLLSSGMDMASIMKAVKDEVKTPAFKRVIEYVEHEIEGGSSVSRAFESTNLFPAHALELMRIGEKNGRLNDNLKVVASSQAKDREFRSKISSAMIYPVFVLCLAGVIGLGISWFILPNLANVFSQLNLKLPLITKILIGVGKFLGAHGIVAVPAILAGMVILIYVLFIFPKTKIIGQRIMFALPGVNRLLKEAELSRLGYIMRSLLDAGIPIVDAFAALEQSSSLIMYSRLYAKMKISIEKGNSLQKTFREIRHMNRYISPSLQQMLVAAEHSGKLPETFGKIAELYEGKTDITTKNLTVILEPLMLIIVWLGVLGVALSIILPIYGLIGNLNNNL
jgi:type IV pilus assembly protein PilC